MKPLWVEYIEYIERCEENEVEEVFTYEEWCNDIVDWGCMRRRDDG